MEAARFLSHASFGGNPPEIEALAGDLNFEKWLKAQFSLAPTLVRPLIEEVFRTAKSVRSSENDVSNYNNSDRHFQMAWWQATVTRPDVLSQQMALALSEVLVISCNSSISDHGSVYTSYYDFFVRNGFGNYRDILGEVSSTPQWAFI